MSRAVTASLTIAGHDWPVQSAEVREDRWWVPAITASVVCDLPEDWQTLPHDARDVLPAVYTHGWVDGDLVEYRLVVQSIEADVVEGTAAVELVSTDIILLRPLDYWAVAGNANPGGSSSSIAEYMGWQLAALGGYAARVGVSIVDHTGGEAMPIGNQVTRSPGDTGVEWFDALTLAPVWHPDGYEDPVFGWLTSAGMHVWRAGRDGNWHLRRRDDVAPLRPGRDLLTARPGAIDLDTLWGPGATAATVDALHAGETLADLDAQLWDVGRSAGTVTRFTVGSDLEDGWGTSVVATLADGTVTSYESAAQVAAVGRWGVARQYDVDESSVAASTAQVHRRHMAQAGLAETTEALADFDLVPSEWVRIDVRGTVFDRRAQAVVFTVPDGLMTLTTRSVDPLED